MKTDLALIVTLLSIALLSGLAAADVFNSSSITPSSFQQRVAPEALP